MKKTPLLLFIVSLLSFANPAYSMIIDLPDVDETGYFKDTNTGYTWMDLDNFPQIPTREAYATMLFGTGFHLANSTELTELQNSIPLTQASFDYHFDVMGGQPFMMPLIACWTNPDGTTGCTPPPPDAIVGFYDNGYGLSKSSWVETDNEWKNSEFYFHPSGLFGPRGPYLVGAFVVDSPIEPVVPEPSTMFLFGAGLIGIFLKKRRSVRE